jgi:hypothetical protein
MALTGPGKPASRLSPIAAWTYVPAPLSRTCEGLNRADAWVPQATLFSQISLIRQ